MRHLAIPCFFSIILPLHAQTSDHSERKLGEAVITARPNINALDIRAKSGVVQTVNMKLLLNKPMIDMSMALQGSVPGLVVINRGELGEKPQIRIRGNSSLRRGDAANEPLYVLDGKVISSDAFLTLNPNDISEIKVLKDAVGTALYGIKAANGVVEITSKRGNTTGRLTASYSMNLGITLQGRRGVEMMHTQEKLDFERRLQIRLRQAISIVQTTCVASTPQLPIYQSALQLVNKY